MMDKCGAIALAVILFIGGCTMMLAWGTRFEPGPGLACDALVHIGFGLTCILTATSVACRGDLW